MAYEILMTFGIYANNENELKDAIFDFTIQVQQKEDEFDEIKTYYYGYVSYKNISKQNLKTLLKETDETVCWLIYENNNIILENDESTSKIEQWLNN